MLCCRAETAHVNVSVSLSTNFYSALVACESEALMIVIEHKPCRL